MKHSGIKHFTAIMTNQKAPEATFPSEEFPDPATQNNVYFKYIDERCGGVAYYTNCIEIDHPQKECNNCGIPLDETVHDGAFVELSERGAQDAGLV